MRGQYFQSYLMDRCPLCYAYFRILPEQIRSEELELVEANNAFANLVNLPVEQLEGATLTQVREQLNEETKTWMDLLISGIQKEREEDIHFDIPSDGRHYRLNLRHSKSNEWIALIENLSDERKEQERLNRLTQLADLLISQGDAPLDYQKITDLFYEMSGAKIMMMNLFDPQGIRLNTIALSGDQSLLNITGVHTHFNLLEEMRLYNANQRRVSRNSVPTKLANVFAMGDHLLSNAQLKSLVRTHSLGEVVIVQIRKDKQLLGNFTFIMPDGKTFTELPFSDTFSQYVGLGIANEKTRQSISSIQKRNHSLLESIPGITYRRLHDRKGTILLHNPALIQMSGYTEDVFQGNGALGLLDLVHPDDLASVVAGIEKSIEENEPWKITYRLRHHHDDFIWVEDHGHQVFHAQGEPGYLEGFIYDISEQLRLTSSLEESRRQFQLISENIEEVFWLRSADNREMIHVSSAYEKIWGRSCKSLYQDRSSFLDAVHPEDKKRVTDAFLLYEKHGYFREQYRIIQPCGDIRWVKVTASPANDTFGNVQAYIGSAVDITDQKKHEESLEKMSALLRKLPEQVPGVVYQYRWHPDGRNYFPFASKQIWEIYEVTPDEIKTDAAKVLARLHPDDHDRVLERIELSAKTLQEWRDTYRVILPSRGERWVSGIAKPEKLEDDSVIWHGYISDITEEKLAEQAMKKYQDRLSHAQRFARAGTWEYHIDSQVLDLSSECQSLLGYNDICFEGTLDAFMKRMHPDDVDQVFDKFKQIREGASTEPIHYEHRVFSTNDEPLWVKGTAGIVKNDQDEPKLITGLIIDITDQKRSEKALHEKERILDTFFDQSLTAFYLMMLKEPIYWDDNTDKEATLDLVFASQRMTRANQAMLDQLRGKKEDVLGLTPQDLFANNLNKGRDFWRKLFDRGRCHVDTSAERLDGTSMIVEGDYICLYDDQGRITGHFGVQNDVTKARAAQKKLAENERRLDAIISNIPVVIYTYEIDKEGSTHLTYINEKVTEILGYSPDDFMKSTSLWLESTHPDDRPSIVDKFKGASTSHQYRIKGKHGQYHWVVDNQKRLTEESGQVQVIGTWWDMTNLKEAEEKLVRFSSMLEATNNELSDAMAEAKRANLAKSQFLANMSHEIRTPMNGILGFLQLLEESPINPNQERYIDYMKTSTETLLTLINDILDLSKIESGKMELEHIPFDLRSAIEATVIAQAHRAQSKSIDLNFLVRPGFPHQVKGDPTRFRQILTNLVANGVKFTENGGVIIECRQIEEKDGKVRIEISVKDTGIGIPAKALPHLFDSFTQVDSSDTRKYGGSGLGLTITRDLVRLMNGTLKVNSQIGQGSVFTIQIPFSKDDTELIELPNRDTLYGKHVMVVDDDAYNREILRTYLEEAGCRVTESPKAISALEKILSFNTGEDTLHCAILDQHMPGMNGEALARSLKAIPDTKSIPLCLLTSVVQNESASESFDAGFEAYLTKPISRRDLLDTVASLINRTEPNKKNRHSINQHTLRDARKKRQLRVLVAEDQAVNRELIIQMLQNRDLHCDVVENGLEAIEACEHTAYDLVLMDIQMPVLDGLEATRRIRANQLIAQPFIAAITAHAMKEDEKRCFEAGMDAYLTKPLVFSEVHSLLRKCSSSPIGALDRDAIPSDSKNNPLPDEQSLVEQSLQRLMDEMAFDRPTAISLLQMAVDNWNDQLKEIFVAMKTHENKELLKLLHKIIGSAANMRVEAIGQTALLAQERVKENDSAGLENDIKKLSELISKFTILNE